MKKLIAIIAVALPLAFSARAQWIVYDPTIEHRNRLLMKPRTSPNTSR